MKRAELESKLTGIENAKELIDFIMAENGKDVNNAKAEVETVKAERDTLKADAEKFKDLTPEKLEAFKLFNPTELKELRDYKTQKETELVRNTKTAALEKILAANNVSNDKARRLLIKAIDLDKIELSEKGDIKDAEKIVNPLKAEYSDFFTEVMPGGARPAPAVPGALPGAQTDLSLAGAVAAKYNK